MKGGKTVGMVMVQAIIFQRNEQIITLAMTIMAKEFELLHLR